MMEEESSIPLKAGSESVAVFPANNEEGNLTTDVCRRQGWARGCVVCVPLMP
jgi:hypothetical protein